MYLYKLIVLAVQLPIHIKVFSQHSGCRDDSDAPSIEHTSMICRAPRCIIEIIKGYAVESY